MSTPGSPMKGAHRSATGLSRAGVPTDGCTRFVVELRVSAPGSPMNGAYRSATGLSDGCTSITRFEIRCDRCSPEWHLPFFLYTRQFLVHKGYRGSTYNVRQPIHHGGSQKRYETHSIYPLVSRLVYTIKETG